MPARELAAIAIDEDPGDLQLLRWYLEELGEWRVELSCYEDPLAAARELGAPGGPDPSRLDVVFLGGTLGPDAQAAVLGELELVGFEGPVILLDEGPRRDELHTAAPVADRLAKSTLSCSSLRRSLGNALEKASLRAAASRARDEAAGAAADLAALEAAVRAELGALEEALAALRAEAAGSPRAGAAAVTRGCAALERLGRALERAPGAGDAGRAA